GRAGEISHQLGAHLPPPPVRVVRIAGESFHIQFDGFEGGLIAYVDEGEGRELIGAWRPGQRLLKARIDGRGRTVQIVRAGRQWRLTAHGASHRVDVFPPHVAALSRRMIEKVPPDLSKYL